MIPDTNRMCVLTILTQEIFSIEKYNRALAPYDAPQSLWK